MNGPTTVAVEVVATGAVYVTVIAASEGYISRWWDVLKGAIPRSDPWDLYVYKLQKAAKKRLCYGHIAQMENEIYGGYWTEPRSGKVRVERAAPKGPLPLRCDIFRCNAHHPWV